MGNPMVSPVSRGKPAILASLLHQNPVWGYAFGMGVYALAFGLRWYLDPILPRGLPFITFLPAVLLVAYFAGRGPAIAMATVSGLTAWYMFVSPDHSFALTGTVTAALIFYLGVVWIAIGIVQRLRHTAEILEQERQANAMLAEQRAFLFRELQHRVANNMAFLVAILSMQKSIVKHHPRASEEVLDDAIRRIRMFSSIHRRLHDPESATQSLNTHFSGLFADLVGATTTNQIRCRVETNGITLPWEMLTTLSLIATELMTNAIKHAFPHGAEGEISLYLGRNGPDLIFIISDNGIGKLAPGDGGGAGLGYTIVEALCEQLKARLTTHVDHGTHVEISFADPRAD